MPGREFLFPSAVKAIVCIFAGWVSCTSASLVQSFCRYRALGRAIVVLALCTRSRSTARENVLLCALHYSIISLELQSYKESDTDLLERNNKQGHYKVK